MNIDLDDKKLISDFLGGNDLAFELVVKKYIKPVYNFLFTLTRDRSALDDLTQNTFIKAWKNIRRFDQNKSFKTWLFTIAKNTAYDYFKKKKTIPFSNFRDVDGNSKLEEISDENVLPLEMLERQDFAIELEKKLNMIPEQYRIILLMRYQDDFSLAEIAEILGKSYNTIKSQHSRALHALKNILTE